MAKLVKKIVGAKVVIEPNLWLRRWRADPEEYAKACRDWVVDFRAFLRDHRSQDANSIDVEMEEEHQCSACLRKYEEDKHEDGTVHCAWCGEEIESPKPFIANN